MPKIINTETRAAIAAAYASGKSSVAVAEQFGVSDVTVAKIAREHGVTIRPNPATKGATLIDDATREQIAKAYETTQSCLAVAKQFGVSTGTVTRIAREFGVSVRGRGRPKKVKTEDAVVVVPIADAPVEPVQEKPYSAFFAALHQAS